MPESVSYKTKIVDVSSVTLKGKIDYGDWTKGDRDSGSAWYIGNDRLDEWLEKFMGKNVSLVITSLGEVDESHLLPENENA